MIHWTAGDIAGCVADDAHVHYPGAPEVGKHDRFIQLDELLTGLDEVIQDERIDLYFMPHLKEFIARLASR